MFQFLGKFALAKLALRHVRALERLASAAEDLRDAACAKQGVAVNREPVDDRELEVSFSTDADTWELEQARAHQARTGRAI